MSNSFSLKRYNANAGFAVLYAVLMVSIVLTVSLSLLNITFKQIILSSVARDSKTAFYAADSALNCAIYWDRKLNSDGTDYSPFGYFDVLNFVPANKEISCAGSSNFLANNSSDPESRISIFSVTFPGNSFAEVTVIKGSGPGPVGNDVDNTVTLIRADGYNTADPNSPRRVQRTLESF